MNSAEPLKLSRPASFVLFFAAALVCQGQELASVQVVATLETGSQAGLKIPVTLAYDTTVVAARGESLVPLHSLAADLKVMQRAEAVFLDGALQSIRLSVRLQDASSPIHNLVLGAAGPDTLGYVDQRGGIGTGSFRLVTLPNRGDLSLIRPLPEPGLGSPLHAAQPNPATAPLVIFAPQLSGTNPLNLVHPSAAPGLLVVDPAPLTLTVPPPPAVK